MSATTNKTFIVPINVEAFRIGDSDSIKGILKGPEFDFSKAMYGPVAFGTQTAQPLITSDGTSLFGDNTAIGGGRGNASGIRLHWALPDAVVKGKMDASQSKPTLAFPKLPNRWLITANYYNNKTNSALPTQQWIVESDTISTTRPTTFPAIQINNPISYGKIKSADTPISTQLGSSTYPAPNFSESTYDTVPNYSSNQAETASYLGNVTPLSDAGAWTPPSTPSAPSNGANVNSIDLNATTHYGPTFTAYYAHGATVCGFFDDFSDAGLVTSGIDMNVSYQVIGWYSDNTKDVATTVFNMAKQDTNAPAQGSSNPGQMGFLYTQFQKELGWKMTNSPSDTDEDFPITCTSIFNGMILNVAYDNANYLTKPDPNEPLAPETISVSIGNNAPEALSAMLTNNSYFQNINFATPSTNTSSTPYPSLETQEGIEFFLDAFQQDFLRRLGPGNASNRIEQVRSMLHKNRFSTYPGGYNWRIRAKSDLPTVTPNSATGLLDTTRNPPKRDFIEAELPLFAAKALSQLNTYQEIYDQNNRKLDSGKKQLYQDWTNLAYCFADRFVSGDGSETNYLSDEEITFLTTQFMSWFTLQAQTGILTTGISSNLDVNKAIPNPTYSSTFKPFGTSLNNLPSKLFVPITSGSSSISVVEAINTATSANGLMDSITSIGLADFAIVLGVQLPTIINKLSSTLNTIQKNQSASEEVIDDLNTYNQILGNIYTLLDGSFINTLLSGISSSLNTLTSNTILSTLPSFQLPVDIATELASYNKIYDLQQIVVLCEANLSMFSASTSVGNIGTGYETLASKLMSTASTNITAISTSMSSLSSTYSTNITTIKNSIENINKALPLFIDLISPNKDNIGVVLGLDITSVLQNTTLGPIKSTYLALQKAINSFDLSTSNGIATTTNEVITTLVDSLPVGQQVLISSKIMNEIIKGLQLDLILQQKKAPHFYLPNNPVISFSENTDAPQYITRVNRNGAATSLPCRETKDIVTAISTITGTNTSLTPSNVFADSSYDTLQTTLQGYITLLLTEGNLLLPQNDTSVTTNSDGTLTTGLLTDLLDYKNAQQNLATPPTVFNSNYTITGTLPYYIGLNIAESVNPFLPLYIAWEVNYQPIGMNTGTPDTTKAYKEYATSILTDYFNLTENDLVTNDNFTFNQENGSITFRGQVSLSDSANDSFTHQIATYYKSKWNIDLVSYYDTAKGNDDWSATLTGIESTLYANLINIVHGNLDGKWSVDLTNSDGFVSTINTEIAQLNAGNTTNKSNASTLTTIKTQIDALASTTTFLTVLQNELLESYVYFKTKTILSQSISGFHDALVQRLQSYQYPFNINFQEGNTTYPFFQGTNLLAMLENELEPMNYSSSKQYSPFKGQGNSNKTYSEILTYNNNKTTMFSPIRGGVLTINKVQIVDVFGQFKNIITRPTTPISITSSMKSKVTKPGSNQVFLPPRFTQPMRMRLLWEAATSGINAFQEFNSHPTYTPICGWLLKNPLDNSLYLYNVDGTALGYFNTPTTAENPVSWNSVPKSATAITNDITTDLENANASLSSFATSFLANMTTGDSAVAPAFEAAIANINQYLLGTGIREKSSLAILKGKPLALVNVCLTLEAYQGTAVVAMSSNTLSNINPNYSGTAPTSDLAGDVTTYPPSANPIYDPSSRNTAGVENVVVPVMLGNNSYLHDGLVGYFIDGDFSTFYATSEVNGTDTGITIQPAATSDIQLSLSNNNISLTLLMDPRVAVHVSSGILPEFSIKIPQDQYQDAMDSLEMFFTVTPTLLSSVSAPGGSPNVSYKFPLPKAPGYQWSWVQPGLAQDEVPSNAKMSDTATFDIYPLQIQDGWLKMTQDKDDDEQS